MAKDGKRRPVVIHRETVLSHRYAQLPTAAQALLGVFSAFWDKDTLDCKAYQGVLAKKLGRSIRTVQTAQSALEDAGLIHVHVVHGRNLQNHFCLVDPKKPEEPCRFLSGKNPKDTAGFSEENPKNGAKKTRNSTQENAQDPAYIPVGNTKTNNNRDDVVVVADDSEEKHSEELFARARAKGVAISAVRKADPDLAERVIRHIEDHKGKPFETPTGMFNYLVADPDSRLADKVPSQEGPRVPTAAECDEYNFMYSSHKDHPMDFKPQSAEWKEMKRNRTGPFAEDPKPTDKEV